MPAAANECRRLHSHPSSLDSNPETAELVELASLAEPGATMALMKRTAKSGTSVHFSGHETFPLRQMWLKKAFEQAEAGGTRAEGRVCG